MARKQTILVGEVGSASAAYKVERYAHMIGLPQATVTWIEDSGMYRVKVKGDTAFLNTPNECIVHLCEVSRVYAKPSQS